MSDQLKTKNFETIGAIICDVAMLLRPPERLTVSQGAAKYRIVNQPGAYVGPWLNSTTPYIVEPANTFTSPTYSGIIFVGPAQCGKTDGLILNPLAYSVKVDPMDMMLICPTMLDARDFSIRRVDRLHRHSPEIGEMMLPGAEADNKYDKQYSSGMLFTMGWPTPSQLAGKPIGRLMLTDRDRMPDDIDGDGEPFDLASKRSTTFGSYAMTLCESSPSREVTNLKWIARPGSHEAPPCGGILGLYNRGDKRRWYWPCPRCGEHFEGKFEYLEMAEDAEGTNVEKANTVKMRCPICAGMILPDERVEMNGWGQWVKEGQGITRDGTVYGPAPRTMIASFWLRGVAAAFITWRKLMALYLDARDEFDRTGLEEALKKFYNNDLGEPYYPKSANDIRLPETLKARAEPSKGRERTVPRGVRFMIATVDVQKNMFVVSVFGIMPGSPFDIFIIDRFDIRKSKRLDYEGDALWLKPHTYAEDWDEIIEHVMNKEYPLDDNSGRMMGIKHTCCDSGGKEGVTTRAYDFYRKLRQDNQHRRFTLVKGEGLPNQPRARLLYPDSGRKDKLSGARGDVPVLFLNSNVLKDELDGRLDCLEPGKGMIRFPDWLSDSFYNELCAELRTPKGWDNPSHTRNEQTDLTYYCIGFCISEFLRLETFNWGNPPSWAQDWDTNSFVRMPEAPPRFAAPVESNYDFAQFGKALA